MSNTPAAISERLGEQLVRPLAEYLVGRRPLRQVEHLVGRQVGLALGQQVVRPRGPIVALNVKAQTRIGFIEVAASVMVDGQVHALALRVERQSGRPVVVALEAPSLR